MREKREIYGWEDGGEVFLSPFALARGTYRPMNRYASRAEAEEHARQRNCRIEWEN